MKTKRTVLCFLFLLQGIIASAQGSTASTACEASAKLLPVLWHQHAAEYRALCYQAFNLATWKLDALKKPSKKDKPYAIITDIDETILDNSYYEAQNIKDGKAFSSATWKQWTDRAAATPVPGALEFLQQAKKKGIAIFYISNRDTSEVQSTVRNLQQFNVPDAQADHLLFMSTTSSKEERRQQVMATYDVVMLLGDNLNDFASLFEKKNIADRNTETDKEKAAWGNRFIVLPNALYGEWENALYKYERGLTAEQKCIRLRNHLKGIE